MYQNCCPLSCLPSHQNLPPIEYSLALDDDGLRNHNLERTRGGGDEVEGRTGVGRAGGAGGVGGDAVGAGDDALCATLYAGGFGG